MDRSTAVWGVRGQELIIGAPVKRASARVKVPSVQLDGSAPQTVPTASPRGGVGSRHGVEPAGRNEHMNHINEPRKSSSGSRTPRIWAKADESDPDQPSWVGQWTGGVCVYDMRSDARVTPWQQTLAQYPADVRRIERSPHPVVPLEFAEVG